MSESLTFGDFSISGDFVSDFVLFKDVRWINIIP